MTPREINAVLAGLRKKDVVALLRSGNSAFSESKLARLTRDQIVETYSVEIRRLIALNIETEKYSEHDDVTPEAVRILNDRAAERLAGKKWRKIDGVSYRREPET